MNTHFRWQVSVTLAEDPNGHKPILAGFVNQADAEHWADMVFENNEYEGVSVDEVPGLITPEVRALIQAAKEAIECRFSEPESCDSRESTRAKLEAALAAFDQSSPEPLRPENWAIYRMDGRKITTGFETKQAALDECLKLNDDPKVPFTYYVKNDAISQPTES